MTPDPEIDEVGYWTEVKLEILAEYAIPYNRILRANHLSPNYIDGFAGAGHHLAKGTERIIEGSPTRALQADPPFDSLHFIDLNVGRASHLKEMFASQPNVIVYQGDCNRVLADEVFPKIRYERRQRALCILDPYGLHLDWRTIQLAGDSHAIEVFLNFPVMDMNRNVFWRDHERVSPTQRDRMDKFWGDESWRNAAYESIPGLFGEIQQRTSNDYVAEAFRARLKTVAGVEFVPKPMPMRNSKGAIVYYLFFASHNATANKIVKSIFSKYGNRGEVENG